MKKQTLFKRARKLAVSSALLLIFLFPALIAARWAYDITGGRDPRQVFSASQLASFKDNRYFKDAVPIKPFSEPLVTITFDDGWESIYSEGLPVLEKYDIKTTQYVLGGRFNDHLYLSEAQINSLQKVGHEIGSHTMTHADLTSLTKEKLVWELRESSRILTEKFNKVQDFASPLGASNNLVLQHVRQYYRSHRNTVGDAKTIEDEDINIAATFDPYNINAFTVSKDTTLDDLRRLIEHTIKRKGWLVLTYHQIDNSNSHYAVTPKVLDEHMKFIRSSKVSIPVSGQVLDAIEGGRR